ncbi:MAG: hypothetical protein OSB41_04730 [Kiritimatiellae bacterium]|nr:hypothetical protein [Kiritimatiellia bacterium]
MQSQKRSKHAPQQLADDGKTTCATVCATCHGGSGVGSVALKTPSIASLPSWYTPSQIEKITGDVRPVATNDVHLLVMREILKIMPPEQLAAICC